MMMLLCSMAGTGCATKEKGVPDLRAERCRNVASVVEPETFHVLIKPYIGNKFKRAELEALPALEGIKLEGSSLAGTNFSGVNFVCADFDKANLEDTFLAGTNLKRASLRGANLAGANLTNANLAEADLSGANLRGTQFNGTQLRDAIFSDTDLHGAHFVNITDLAPYELMYLQGRSLQ